METPVLRGRDGASGSPGGVRQQHRAHQFTPLILPRTVPADDDTVAEQSKNYRYSTNHQVVIDADTRPVAVAVVGRSATVASSGAQAR